MTTTHTTPQPQKIAIIGAGIAGLTLAQALQNRLTNIEISLFEKARGVSGRTSTRRAEPYHFDHGASFFTAKSERFRQFLQPMIDAGAVVDWQARVTEFVGTQAVDNYQWQANSHFIGSPKMNEMAKYLAKDLTDKMGDNLTIHLGSRVGHIHKIDSTDIYGSKTQWQLTSDTGAKVGKAVNAPLELGDEGDLGIFDWVVCTAPPEQAVELIPDTLDFYSRIADSKTEGCYSLMLGFDSDMTTALNIDFEVALIKDSPLSCITVNQHKPNRPDVFSLTIVASNHWAEQHLDDDQAWVKSELLTATAELLNIDITTLQQASHSGMHRWRYANTSPHLDKYNQDKPSFLLDTDNKIAVAGDWLIKGSVENAFISADSLAEAMASSCKSFKIS